MIYDQTKGEDIFSAFFINVSAPLTLRLCINFWKCSRRKPIFLVTVSMAAHAGLVIAPGEVNGDTNAEFRT
jgi:hypothetical protein